MTEHGIDLTLFQGTGHCLRAIHESSWQAALDLSFRDSKLLE